VDVRPLLGRPHLRRGHVHEGKQLRQVRGHVQLTFARSVDRIFQQEITITRKSVTTQEDAEAQLKKDGNITGTMGRKSIVPYGLYLAHGFVSAHEATGTGFGEADLAVLWDALKGMFDHDRSASRGLMAPRKLIVFKHQNALGNAPAHKLFEAMKITRTSEAEVPRAFTDYALTLDRSAIPATVEVIEML